MRHNYFRTTLWIVVTLVFLASCSSNLEPYDQPDASNRTIRTRTIMDDVHTFSVHEAQMIANNKLKKRTVSAQNAKIKPVLAKQQENLPLLLSDTVAYVVNYSDNQGFVIVANDSRADSVLAYSDKGNFSEENLMAKILFLDKIENYLASLSDSNKVAQAAQQGTSTGENAPVRRIIVEPQITTQLGPTSPFNKKIEEEHPGYYASFVNIAAANIISHTKNNLDYKGYHYNFETINYALNQGPGFSPFKPETISPLGFPHDFPLMTFTYTYEGSVAAYNQLLCDLSKDETTYYLNGIVFTDPTSVIPIFKSMGLEVTETFRNTSDINHIGSLLFNGYLVNMALRFDSDSEPITIPMFKGPAAWVIDGCNLFLNKENKIESGEVHCNWGWFDLGTGYYSYPILTFGDGGIIHTTLYFGVKSNED